MGSAFSEDRLAQLVIQYACRTTPVGELKAQKKKEILARMKELWPDLCDGELEGPVYNQLEAANPGLLCALKKSIFLAGMTAEAPTLLITTNTLTLAVPRKLQGQPVSTIDKHDFWLKDNANAVAQKAMLSLAQDLGVQIHRAGKIAEMVFGQVAPDELQALKDRLFGSLAEKPANIQADLTFVRQVDEQEYNWLLKLHAAPANLELPCPVMVKVDVNNRDMTKGLHPRDMTRIWGVADEGMPGWAFDKLGGGC